MLLAKYRTNRVLNDEVKYRHDECQGNTGNLYVRYGLKNGSLGWFYHCHSCASMPGGVSGFHSAEKLSAPSETLAQLRALLASPADVIADTIALPDDITYNLPPIVIKYMLKYNLTDFEVGLSRFGWSRGLDRLIMPVYVEEELVYWQGRNLGEVTEDRPKYKNVYLSGSRDIFAKFYRRDRCLGLADENTVVLVEAIISAVKLSRHVDSIALLGSYISPSILELVEQYKTVLIWLDPDKKPVSIKESIRMQMLSGKAVKSVLTDKKPKQYNDKDIICNLNF